MAGAPRGSSCKVACLYVASDLVLPVQGSLHRACKAACIAWSGALACRRCICMYTYVARATTLIGAGGCQPSLPPRARAVSPPQTLGPIRPYLTLSIHPTYRILLLYAHYRNRVQAGFILELEIDPIRRSFVVTVFSEERSHHLLLLLFVAFVVWAFLNPGGPDVMDYPGR